MKYPHWFNPDTRQEMKDSLKEQWFNNVLELGDTDKLEEVIEENSDLIADYFLTYVKKMKTVKLIVKGESLVQPSSIHEDLGYKLQDMIYRKLDDKCEQEVEWEVNE